MINHITHEGVYAGQTYCGLPRDNNSAHLPYVSDLDTWVENHIECEHCKGVFQFFESEESE